MRCHLGLQFDKSRLRRIGADKAARADVVGRYHGARQFVGQYDDTSEKAGKGRRSI